MNPTQDARPKVDASEPGRERMCFNCHTMHTQHDCCIEFAEQDVLPAKSVETPQETAIASQADKEAYWAKAEEWAASLAYLRAWARRDMLVHGRHK